MRTKQGVTSGEAGQTVEHSATKRRIVLPAVTAMAAAAAVPALSPGAAEAGTDYFCLGSGSPSYTYLGAYANPVGPDRCTTRAASLTDTAAFNDYGYDVCAAVKDDASGTGPNEPSSAYVSCRDSSAFVGMPFPLDGFYATVINKQGAGHHGFYGEYGY